MTHRIRSTDRNGMVKYFVDFHGPTAKRLIHDSPLQSSNPMQLGRTRWVEMIFDMMIATGNEPKQAALMQSRHLLNVLIMRLATDSASLTSDTSSSYETFVKCRQYIQTHHAQLQTIEEVAQACHVDRAYLSRLIKRYAHEGAYQYLVRLKMQHAAERLVKDKQSIQESALAAGYDDAALFSKVFKRIHGISPRGFVATIGR